VVVYSYQLVNVILFIQCIAHHTAVLLYEEKDEVFTKDEVSEKKYEEYKIKFLVVIG
jgi:hypothetical protein